ncbi:MAG: hypothetical protein IT428_10475 [Planctomycetaceae bacterium]|nr:hypothetical protein [Planctomycetaceae bacterium]
MTNTFPFEVEPRRLRFPEADSLLEIAGAELATIYREFDERVEGLLAELARVRFHLRRSVDTARREHAEMTADAVETLACRLDALLEQNAVTVEDRTGQTWNEEWSDQIDIRQYRRNTSRSETVVSYQQSPVVRQAGRLIARGIADLEGPPRD